MTMTEKEETPEQRYERLLRQARKEQGDEPDLFVHQTELRAGLLEERAIIFHAIVEVMREMSDDLNANFTTVESDIESLRREVAELRALVIAPKENAA